MMGLLAGFGLLIVCMKESRNCQDEHAEYGCQLLCMKASDVMLPAALQCFVLQEHLVYPYAVSALVDGRITWREDGIPIIWESR